MDVIGWSRSHKGCSTGNLPTFSSLRKETSGQANGYDEAALWAKGYAITPGSH